MKTIEQIAAELQGYDPQALSADRVNEFLAQLVQPVRTGRGELLNIVVTLPPAIV